MSPDLRRFSLGAVLSVTTGRLLAPIGELYDLLNFMTGDNLMTHQLPRAVGECAPVLLARHPALRSVVVPESLVGAAAVETWVAGEAVRLGSRLTVATLDPGAHTIIDPIEELLMLRPDAQIIVVDPEETP